MDRWDFFYSFFEKRIVMEKSAYRIYSFLFIWVAVSMLFVTGCGKKEFSLPEDLPHSDGKKAMAYAEKCVSFVDRYSGSKAILDCGNWIKETLQRSSFLTVEEESFTEETPSGRLPFRNIVAKIPGKSADYVIVGAHYDTKRFSSFPFTGANDGASGTAALLLLAETLAKSKTKLPYSLHLVFFDGEECLVEYGKNDGLHGSKYHAANLEKTGGKGKCRAMILLDMTGDKSLCITPPANSHPQLLSLFEKSASFLKKKELIGKYDSAILDDHVPFLEKGIPSIDLIDFSYGPDNIFWHTPEDTLDKISGESIAFSVDLTLVMLYNMKKGGL